MGPLAAHRLREGQGARRMSKKQKRKFDKNEIFIKVMIATMDAPAWLAMSLGARLLFIALRRRLRNDVNNNGAIFLSLRDAEKELGSKRDYIARWFRELEYYRFIVQTRPGILGSDGNGKAPHYRLTDLPYMDHPPSRDFLAWDGVKFDARGWSAKADQGWSLKADHRSGPQKRTIGKYRHMAPKGGPYLDISSQERATGEDLSVEVRPLSTVQPHSIDADERNPE
jgi:hypothetical protein